MKRCHPLAATCRGTFLALALCTGLLGTSTPATAQTDVITRVFPASAARGELKVLSMYTAELDGKVVRLSPGARIRDASNRIVLSSTLIGQEFDVNYTRDATQQVYEVWILTPAEAARPRPSSSGQ